MGLSVLAAPFAYTYSAGKYFIFSGIESQALRVIPIHRITILPCRRAICFEVSFFISSGTLPPSSDSRRAYTWEFLTTPPSLMKTYLGQDIQDEITIVDIL
jgi:hypothetical protein